MLLLSEYLEQINNKEDKKINPKIFNSWIYFGYPNDFSFKIDLELLLETIYDSVILIDVPKKLRISQNEFRTKLIQLYHSRCVISLNSNPDELEAAHIVEVANGGDYDISNGLMLEANLHKTFDKYQWTINPDTMKIETKNNISIGSIGKYVDNKINLELDPILYSNLKFRYDKFIG